jgi:hypothetical protein
MRRRLLNQLEGDPAQRAIDDLTAKRMSDIARLPRLQPHIASRRERERVTNDVREETGSRGASFQGRSGMSSRPGVLPPSPAAPRPILRLKRLGED